MVGSNEQDQETKAEAEEGKEHGVQELEIEGGLRIELVVLRIGLDEDYGQHQQGPDEEDAGQGVKGQEVFGSAARSVEMVSNRDNQCLVKA